MVSAIQRRSLLGSTKVPLTLTYLFHSSAGFQVANKLCAPVTPVTCAKGQYLDGTGPSITLLFLLTSGTDHLNFSACVRCAELDPNALACTKTLGVTEW